MLFRSARQGEKMVQKGRLGNLWRRRNRRNTVAAVLNSGEIIRRPGGDSKGAFWGDERGGRGLFIGGNRASNGALNHSESRAKISAESGAGMLKMMTSAMTSSLFLFLFSFPDFEIMLQIKSNKFVKIKIVILNTLELFP